ncbi:MAG: hypothetical protein JST21_18765 [Bacteroidetes bacterium]|nr:hypothetical protein [Bacteroidota bacterium]MBS1748207.1 hypothetical protein [Bacteroidota bacterium]
MLCGDSGGGLKFASRGSINGGTSGGTQTNNDIRSYTNVFIAPSGKVVIGNTLISNGNYPGNYKLYVQDGILTEHVRVAVKTTGDWSDDVFEAQYPLMNIYTLQQFITRYHHLPNIPSAADVVKNGIDLQQMDSKLLQKIEELTLYVIKQQKEIDALKKKTRKL